MYRTNNYESLTRVFNLALERASKGKGQERHGLNKPFDKQPIVTEGEHFGTIFHLAQIRKKALEIMRMDKDAAKRELLDIIVYAAGAYIVLETDYASKL